MSSPSAEAASILHVVASPKGKQSASTQVGRAFLDAYGAAHPDHTVTTLDLWSADLPAFDGDLAAAKLAPLLGESTTATQDEAWAQVVDVIDEFRRHTKIVLSTPMWNFGLPYRLKHFFDLLVQPGITFGLDSAFEHVGLLADRPVQLILTRSSAFPEGNTDDYQLPYLRHILGFMGINDVRALVVEGTTLPQDARDELVAGFCDQARALAVDF